MTHIEDFTANNITPIITQDVRIQLALLAQCIVQVKLETFELNDAFFNINMQYKCIIYIKWIQNASNLRQYGMKIIKLHYYKKLARLT